MDNKIVIGLKIDEEPVTCEILGFTNAITTLDELAKSKEFIDRASDDNYVLNLILRRHHLLPILIACITKRAL